jgi:hypothetical protein
MLYFTGVISGTLTIGLGMLAAAFLLISLRAFLPTGFAIQYQYL